MKRSVWKIRGVLLLSIIFFAGCENDEPVVADTITELSAYNFGSDEIDNIVIYNGRSTSIDDGVLQIGNDLFYINTTDSELSAGKEYQVSINGDDFKMFYSALPIVSISTNGARINDDPKVNGEIYLIKPGETAKTYDIGIELRGGVSKEYPKPSYSVELWEDETGDNTVKKPLLGMRDDDDWVMDGLWNEPIRVRDFTSHGIWLEIGRIQNKPEGTKIGIDRKYCELFLNGRYKGVYYLGEKIDRKQLDLEKFVTQMEGELYKGYTWADGVTFDGIEGFDNSSEQWSGYEFKYPDNEDKIDWTNLHGFVDFVVNSSQADFDSQISSKVDLQNMADYFIFMNLLYAGDNTGKNVYTAKMNSASLYFFIPWDLDSSFGDNWKGERTDVTDRMLSNGLYDKLLNYPEFNTEVKARWNELRNSTLATASLQKRFRDNFEYLKNNGVYEREALVSDLPFNYRDTEIDFIESWIDRRVTFLDTFFDNL